MEFVPDKIVDAVPLGEPLHQIVLVLPNARDQVGGNANVQCPDLFAREDVYTGLLHASIRFTPEYQEVEPKAKSEMVQPGPRLEDGQGDREERPAARSGVQGQE
jgi:hypothetical protein